MCHSQHAVEWFIPLLASVILWEAGVTMRNANKLKNKMSYSAMLSEVEKWSGIRMQHQITTKSQSILHTNRPNHSTKLQQNQSTTCTYQVALLTDKPDQLYNLLQLPLA